MDTPRQEKKRQQTKNRITKKKPEEYYNIEICNRSVKKITRSIGRKAKKTDRPAKIRLPWIDREKNRNLKAAQYKKKEEGDVEVRGGKRDVWGEKEKDTRANFGAN